MECVFSVALFNQRERHDVSLAQTQVLLTLTTERSITYKGITKCVYWDKIGCMCGPDIYVNGSISVCLEQ